jgi:hypothetical protein
MDTAKTSFFRKMFGAAAVVGVVGGVVWGIRKQPMPFVSVQRSNLKMDIKFGNAKPGTSMFVDKLVFLTTDGQETDTQNLLLQVITTCPFVAMSLAIGLQIRYLGLEN